MTKSEQAQAFLDAINNTASQMIFSWEINRLLHEAEKRTVNFIMWPLERQRDYVRMPEVAFESNIAASEILRTLGRSAILDTTYKGFLSQPQDFYRTVQLFALKDPECPPAPDNLVEVQWQQMQQLGPRFSHSLAKPLWDDKTTPERYRVFYHNETAPYQQLPAGAPPEAQQPGWRLLPARQYRVRLNYIIEPPAGAVQNFAWEQQFAGNPMYKSNPADINSILPDFTHEMVVRWAVMLFHQSLQDPAALQVSAAKPTPPGLP